MVAPLLADSPSAVGSWMRSIRTSAGVSQAELARRLRTTQSVVSRWENGNDEPRLSTLRRIAAACEFALILSVEPVDVDRAQIRQMLAASPEERLAGVENLSRMLAVARRVD